MGRPSKEELDKREAARKQVEEVFGDIITFEDKDATSVAKKIEDFKKDTTKESSAPAEVKNIKWLEDELRKATEENEKLSAELATKKEDYEKLFNRLNSSGVVDADSDSLKSGIRKVFKELEANYTGHNATKTPYRDVKIKAMLDKLLQVFPFLIEEKKRRKHVA